MYEYTFFFFNFSQTKIEKWKHKQTISLVIQTQLNNLYVQIKLLLHMHIRNF